MPDHPRSDSRSDAQLVEAINAGSEQAFEVLYRRHRDWVVRLAMRFTRDRDAALDVMQETFIYLLGKVPNLILTARLTTFLYPVVKHLALAQQRKTRRERPAAELPDPPAAGDAPAEQSRADLAAVLGALSASHREVVLMRYVDGLSMAEIAAALQIPDGTVKSRLHHALRQLRDDPRTKRFFDR